MRSSIALSDAAVRLPQIRRPCKVLHSGMERLPTGSRQLCQQPHQLIESKKFGILA